MVLSGAKNHFETLIKRIFIPLTLEKICCNLLGGEIKNGTRRMNNHRDMKRQQQ